MMIDHISNREVISIYLQMYVMSISLICLSLDPVFLIGTFVYYWRIYKVLIKWYSNGNSIDYRL